MEVHGKENYEKENYEKENPGKENYGKKNHEGGSIWRKTVSIPEREPLRGIAYAEVAVVGGGLAGLLTAYFLQEQGKKVVVLEADRIGSGQTENTTAKITSQHGLVYTTLCRKYGRKKAFLYAQANQEAVMQYRKLIEKEGIVCHLERLPSFFYSKTEAASLKKEAEIAKKCGIPASFTTKTKLPFPVKGAVVFEDQAQFHPLEFIRGLAEKLEIYEKTRVLRVKKHALITDGGTLQADSIVFTTHYPFRNVPGFYFARQHQERSYVLAVSGAPNLEGMYYSDEKDGLSFRNFADLLLVGGGGHRTGAQRSRKRPTRKEDAPGTAFLSEESSSPGETISPGSEALSEEGYHFLHQKVHKLFPDAKVEAYWSAQDCVTQDDLPFAGKYSIFCTNWYIISGLKKWGMTGAMVSARIVCDAVCGRENPYQKLFRPQRFSLRASAKGIFADLRYTAAGLWKGHFHLPLRTRLPEKGGARIVRRGFRRYGVYRDAEGGLHWVSVKCPHLGCELAWNLEEKSWDCPCHGSRFDCDGKLLDNPAQRGIARRRKRKHQ